MHQRSERDNCVQHNARRSIDEQCPIVVLYQTHHIAMIHVAQLYKIQHLHTDELKVGLESNGSDIQERTGGIV